VLSIRNENESGKQTVQEVTESWARDDDQTVTFSKEYPIGENVELMSVRALRTRCTCAAEAQTNAQSEWSLSFSVRVFWAPTSEAAALDM
jgi:hypothetical protein